MAKTRRLAANTNIKHKAHNEFAISDLRFTIEGMAWQQSWTEQVNLNTTDTKDTKEQTLVSAVPFVLIAKGGDTLSAALRGAMPAPPLQSCLI